MKNKKTMKNKNQKVSNYASNKLRKLHSCGNTKLPNTTFIFNMGDCHSCPSFKLGLCDLRKNCNWKQVDKDICYGIKAEKLYKACKPYRIRQKNYWLNCTAEQFIDDFAEIYKRKRIKPTLLRFNEGSDFHGQNCVNKAEKIAGELLNRFNVKCHTYTHRTDLDFSKVYFLNVLNSTTKPVNGLNAAYIALDKVKFAREQNNKKYANRCDSMREIEKYRNVYFCPASCKKCTLCATVKRGVIYTVIH